MKVIEGNFGKPDEELEGPQKASEFLVGMS